MGTWTTVGHAEVVASLQRSFQQGRIAHTYLLVGPSQVGKMTLALDLARLVSCRHEAPPCAECDQCRRITQRLHADVQVVDVERGDQRNRVNIGIDQVRELQKAANLKPFEGRYRVFIIDGAERLSEEAANALLKILEEPPDQVIMVLLAVDSELLLPTTVSRCRRLDLRPLDLKLVAGELAARFGCDAEKTQEVARLSGGRIGWALDAMDDPRLLEARSTTLATVEKLMHDGLEARFEYANELARGFASNRDSTQKTLALWLEWWRDVMMVKEGAPELAANLSRSDELHAASSSLSRGQVLGAIRSIQEASQDLERNVNPRLALEGLMLSLPRLVETAGGAG